MVGGGTKGKAPKNNLTERIPQENKKNSGRIGGKTSAEESKRKKGGEGGDGGRSLHKKDGPISLGPESVARGMQWSGAGEQCGVTSG